MAADPRAEIQSRTAARPSLCGESMQARCTGVGSGAKAHVRLLRRPGGSGSHGWPFHLGRVRARLEWRAGAVAGHVPKMMPPARHFAAWNHP